MSNIWHITKRLWLYGRGGWDGPWLSRHAGGDEYGRNTLVLRLSGERAVVWAYRTCRCSDCDETRRETAQAEAETQRVMAFYGVDRDAVYELSGDDWNRALSNAAA